MNRRLTDSSVVRAVYDAFRSNPPPSSNVLDTSGEKVDATVTRIRSALIAGNFSLP